LTTPLVTNAGTLALSATGANIVTASTNGVERLRVTSAGNVGIGVTSPIYKLNVNGDISNDTVGAGRFVWNNTGNYLNWIESDGVSGNNFMRFGVANAERMRIDSSGKVGIGTSSPATKLALTGSGDGGAAFTINQTATNWDSAVLFQENGTSKARIAFQNSAWGGGVSDTFNIFTTTSTAMRFGTNNTERLRIDSSGVVGVGVTPSAWGGAFRAIQFGSGGVIAGDTGAGYRTRLLANAYHDGSSYRYIASAAALMQTADGNTSTFQWASTGSGTAGDTISFSERMRIDASGNLLVGTTSTTPAVSNDTDGIALQANGTVQFSANATTTAIINRKSTDGDILQFRKNGTIVGSIGVSGTILNLISEGTELYVGTSGAAEAFFDAPGGIGFSVFTSYDGLTDLGRSNARFDDIYATNGTIQTSDRNEKQDIEELDEAERRVAVACKGLLRKFRWKDAVAEKGDDARIHFGIIAQDLQAAFEAEGLDAGRYAMFIHSTWTDEETGEEKSRMGVRYPQLLAFIIAAI
jgi:hypothetical protein